MTDYQFLLSVVLMTLMVILTVVLHYEVLFNMSKVLPKLHWCPNRMKLLLVMLAVFAAHTAEMWLYAFCYRLGVESWGLGNFGGITVHKHFTEYVYFSASTYTSLGFGDVVPTGGVRLLAGAEALAGLLMIAWSASYTYISMERFWGFRRDS